MSDVAVVLRVLADVLKVVVDAFDGDETARKKVDAILGETTLRMLDERDERIVAGRDLVERRQRRRDP